MDTEAGPKQYLGPPPTSTKSPPFFLVACLVVIGIIFAGTVLLACIAFGFALAGYTKAQEDAKDIRKIRDGEINFNGYQNTDASADLTGKIQFDCNKEVIHYTLNYKVNNNFYMNGFFLWNYVHDIQGLNKKERIIKLCKANPPDTSGFEPGSNAPICPAGNPDCFGVCKYEGTIAGTREISYQLCNDVIENILNYNLAINSTNNNFAALADLDRTQ